MGNEDPENETNPGRGSGSKPVEQKLHAESYRSSEKPLLKIDDPNTPETRVYRLTDDIKEVYERLYRRQLEKLDAHWYDMRWEGTELIIEFAGPIRSHEMREERTMWPPIEKIKEQYQGGPGVVKVEEKGFGFDKALMPVEGATRLDFQERANKKPLQVEDQIMFATDGEEPVKTTKSIEEEMEVEMPQDMDFEDDTNDRRGEMWQL